MKWLFLTTVITGMAGVMSCASLELLSSAGTGGQPVAVSPADNPTAGHAITPNQFELNRSIEWLWDQNGVYLLDPGSSIARELFIDGINAPIPNLQGVTFSLHGSGLEEFYVWLWTPIAVYRYSADGTLVKVKDAAANDISGVQNIIAIPGPVINKIPFCCGPPNNFYELWSVGEPNPIRSQLRRLCHKLQTIEALPNPNYILLWNVSRLYIFMT